DLPAASVSGRVAAGSPRLGRLQPLLPDVFPPWQAASIETVVIRDIQPRVANPGGHRKVMDPEPGDAKQSGIEGGVNHLGRLSVLGYGMGHRLGHDPRTGNWMNDPVATGIRLAPADIDALFAEV